MTALRPSIFYMHPLLMGRLPDWDAHFARAAALGFDTVALAPPFAPGRFGDVFLTGDHAALHPVLDARDAAADIATVASQARAHGLTLILDLVADRVAEDAVLARERPDWFEPAPARDLPDPRIPPESTHAARFRPDALRGEAGEWWAARIGAWLDAGIGGLRCVAAHHAPAAFWRTLVPQLRPRASLLIADIIGATDAEAAALSGCGFDFAVSSSCYWDFRAAWIADDERRVAAVGSPLAMPEPPFGQRLSANLANHGLARRAAERAARFAAAHGAAWLVPMGFEYGASRALDPIRDRPDVYERLRAAPAYDLCDLLAEINGARPQQAREAARLVSAPGDRVSVLLQGTPGPRCCLVAVNTALDAPARLDPAKLPPDARAAYTVYAAAEGVAPDAIEMPPGGVVILAPRALPPILLDQTEDVIQATRAPRIAIESVSPAVDNGRFPVKRVVGDIVTVDADIICDGHDRLGVVLLWRCADEQTWRRVKMVDLGNDRWQAAFPLTRLGRHVFTVEAWRDAFATFSHELHAKHAAGVAIGVELEEGFRLVQQAAGHAPAETRAEHAERAARLAAASAEERRAVLFDPRTAELMALADDQPFGVRLAPGIALDAERPEAGFASWYELFPRSVTDDPARHGTFRDVIGRLPAIRDMGFDVLYFPPIHPIGRANRKGRNNSLTPAPDDPGSPYAIGAEAGGHDAIHPELGTLEDFRALRDAASAHGLELALDFAIQCSPDHPWLRDHPDWFAWRADGSLRYAENPPKKYEDIVNVDFYAPGAIPSLWEALRDVVLFWVNEGVLIFRVDNPHTKPLPFWEWLIGEVRGKHPGAMFLAEAFTKPKMMHRLAKVGFSQSYTYFTWRNTKAELRTYLEELNEAPVRDFFRPNFFVNTPDINPVFLQNSGRAGFLIRAALAATLAGLWGLYSGFELCEAAALPGREEYLDSEKYQIRVWDWDRPGNIIAEITRLNRIRRANPALQTHLGVTFLNAFNDNILYFEKASPGRANVVLVAVNLDPYAAQEADIELPLWRWSLPDDATLYVEDLMGDRAFVWRGKRQHIRLEPAGLPFAIWRVRPDTGA